MELIRSLYAPSLRIYSIYSLSPLRPNFFPCDKKKILPASVLNWTNFKPNRAHWLVGFPILMAFGCTLIHGGVHTRTHMYWGRGIHYRGCTFIAGGVHTRTHVYWGRGIHYRGCTFIAGDVHTRTHVYWGGASTTGGVPSQLGVCIPGRMCTGGGASTTGGVPSYLGVCIPGRISCHNQSKISSHLN